MIKLLIPLFLIFLIYFPYLYVRYIYQNYNKSLELMPFNGKEFADKILNDQGLKEIKVEPQNVSLQNFYNPTNKSIGIEDELLNKKSLTSLSIIAHEVGHAIQHKENYKPLIQRHDLLEKTVIFRTIGSSIVTLGVGPIFAFTHSLSLTLIATVIALLFFCIEIFINLFTLKCEYDASFKRAMPILKENVPEEYIEQCKRVLNAAALTYVANSIIRVLSLRNFFFIFLRLIKR